MFQALEAAPEHLHRINLAVLQKIMHLAASTMDLEIIRGHNDVGTQGKRALEDLVRDRGAYLRLCMGAGRGNKEIMKKPASRSQSV